MSDWTDKWDAVSFALKGRPMRLHDVLTIVGGQWPELVPMMAALKIPNTEAVSSMWMRAAEQVDRDLRLEAGETPDDPVVPTRAEFLESVGRALIQVCSTIQVPSPHDHPTGLRRVYNVGRLLQSTGIYMQQCAQWLGEPVGRAGEGRPQFDPHDWGDGTQPWSMP